MEQRLVNDPTVQETERAAIIRARNGQGLKERVSKIESRCRITSVEFFLRRAHRQRADTSDIARPRPRPQPLIKSHYLICVLVNSCNYKDIHAPDRGVYSRGTARETNRGFARQK